MSHDLLSQLADYGRDHQAQQRPFDIAASRRSGSASSTAGVADQSDLVDDADVIVVDLHGPISAHVIEQRKSNPDLTYSNDGVHLDKDGNRLMAAAIHQSFYNKPLPDTPAEIVALISKQHALLHPAWLSHVGHKRPGLKPGLPLKEAKAKAVALKAN